ncbi:MAG TPA: C39 family peptidase [Nocardioidaceae bacterium]|nr:C39 family peptidase [Nocardioidaceae bacterium]
MRTLSRTRVISRILVGTTAAALVVPLTVLPSTAAHARTIAQRDPRQITYQQWDTQRQLTNGRFIGTRSVRGVLQLAEPAGTRTYDDPHGYRTKRYDFGRWISPWRSPGYAFDQLIPSWDATTPGDSWVQIQVRGRSESGRLSKWYTMANWAAGDRRFHRTSLGAQADDLAQVDVDTLKTKYSMGFTSWQMSITLLRKDGTTVTPTVDTVGAMTSHLPAVTRVRTSRPGVASGIRLRLPRYSQMIHEGDYPQYDGGGEAWCSPTSVSMVLGYDRRLPSDRAIAWVPAGHPDRWVDHAARSQYDYGFEGAGNWSFSAAYAATHADSAFVTRLRNLREAERFIKAGIPLVASVKFAKGQLTGAPIGSTNGHLLVIVGFTADGDVVVNDPAAPRSRTVVRTYDRGQFENAWIPKSGGLVYVVRNRDRALPATQTSNW